jgi:hypothetical protein
MYNFRVAAGIAGGFGTVAFLFALPALLPPAIANEEPAHTLLSTASEIFPPPFDPGSLVKWSYELEPAVSTDVLKQSTIRKIGYGNTEFVQVLETPSGTYSTDALQSPYVEYPGVIKKRTHDQVGMAFWSNGGWVTRKFIDAGSFVTVTRFDGGQLVVTDDGMCVTRENGVICN